MAALQWLLFMQDTCPDLSNRNGDRVKLQHQYFRGEHQIGQFTVDGFANVDGNNIYFEFLGCHWHSGCPHCSRPGDIETDEIWTRKKPLLESTGVLHVMRECQWSKFVKKLHNFDTPDMPQIMKRVGYEKDIISGVQEGVLYGFLVADIATPPAVYEKIKWINFPPVIQRAEITEENLSPYMKERVREENVSLPRKTVIQSYNGTQILLYSELAKFYLDLGLKLSNVSLFMQYAPAKPLQPFVERVTRGRMQATLDNNDNLGLAFKLVGNAGYGKLGEAVERYDNIYYTSDTKCSKMMRSALYKDHNLLSMENGDHELIEISMKPRKIVDNKPIAMAVKILQDSKLHFLKFIYDVLWKFVKPGSLKLSYCDTDSICLCKL